MKVTSFDGTVIDCAIAGSGPPLLIIPGTGDDQRRFNRINGPLAEHFTVYVMDRRGRGVSGDADDYSVDHEVRDILAVLNQLGEPVHLLAHSYGARLALEAALVARNIAKLLLYEPPIPGIYEDVRRPVVEAIAKLGEAGDREGIVETYLRDFFGTSETVIKNQKSKAEAWAKWMQMAHTIPRELVHLRRCPFEAEKFSNFDIPTRILIGGASRPELHAASNAVRDAISHADIVELPEQGHIGMTTAPKMFVDAALEFYLA